MTKENLNQLKIRDEAGGEHMKDFSTSTNEIDCIFRGIKKRILQEIRDCDEIHGCIAWLTDYDILDEMSKKSSVQIVVQKEDFLRPDRGDIKDRKTWAKRLREKYNNLSNDMARHQHPSELVASLSFCGGEEIDPVKCVGNYNSDKSPAFPRMHNKFIVLLKNKIPYKVITGSFNFSHNAGNSLENILIIKNKDIINAYYREYCQILALSESLNWDSEWSSPEWRIGS